MKNKFKLFHSKRNHLFEYNSAKEKQILFKCNSVLESTLLTREATTIDLLKKRKRKKERKKEKEENDDHLKQNKTKNKKM